MNLLHALLAVGILLVSNAAIPQTCSGGVGGGMDATGCDCNLATETEEGRVAIRVESIAAIGQYSFERGIEEYEKRHYADAVLLLKRSAESGDVRAAEVLALMYQFGKQLFGDSVRSDRTEAAHFAELATRLRQRREADEADEAEQPAP